MEYPTAACKAKHKHDHPEDCRVSVSRNVVIRDFVATNNYRQGLSVTGAVDLLVEDSLFELTGGTAPMCGIDIEPDTTGNLIQNVVSAAAKSVPPLALSCLELTVPPPADVSALQDEE